MSKTGEKFLKEQIKQEEHMPDFYLSEDYGFEIEAEPLTPQIDDFVVSGIDLISMLMNNKTVTIELVGSCRYGPKRLESESFSFDDENIFIPSGMRIVLTNMYNVIIINDIGVKPLLLMAAICQMTVGFLVVESTPSELFGK